MRVPSRGRSPSKKNVASGASIFFFAPHADDAPSLRVLALAMPASGSTAASAPSRDELRRRLRDKIRGARERTPAAPATTAPDVASELLRRGVDDAAALQLAQALSSQPAVLASLKRAAASVNASSSPSSSNPQSSRATSRGAAPEDDEEAPPPLDAQLP